MTRKVILFFLLFIFTLQSKADVNIDSLKLVISTSADTSKISALIQLGWYYRNWLPSEGVKFANQAIVLAIANNRYYQLAEAYSICGVSYRNLSVYDKSYENYLLGLNTTIKYSLPEQEGFARINLGSFFVDQNNFSNATGYLEKALEIGEKIKNLTITGYAKLHLGRVAIIKHDYKNALLLLNESLKLREAENDSGGQAVCLKYIGDVHYYMDNYDKALESFSRSKSFISKGRNPFLLSSILTSISNVYLEMKQFVKAAEYAQKAIDAASDVNSKTRVRNAYLALSNSQIAMGLYDEALESQKLVMAFDDSTLQHMISEQVLHLNRQTEIRKNEAEIELLNKNEQIKDLEISKKNLIIRIFSIAAALLFIVIGVLIYLNIVNQRSKRLIREQNEQLIELNSSRDKFFSIISHDLRSPFNSILGFSELLLANKDVQENEKLRKIMSRLRTTAKHTYGLLENLLDWSRVQRNLVNPEYELLNIHLLILEIVNLYEETSVQKGITIKVISDEDSTVKCDEYITKTIIRNLLNNALKFTAHGGLIIIRFARTDDEFQISVGDNGVGISAEKIDDLFQLSRVSVSLGTANENGTGLGLPLCQDLAEKQGGRIWVSSEYGKGSIFTFSIPFIARDRKVI